MADVFAQDAILQGLHPYSVGRQGVIDYYGSQSPGRTVTYRIRETRRPAADLAFPNRRTVTLYLSVLATRGTYRWSIAHYQASKLD